MKERQSTSAYNRSMVMEVIRRSKSVYRAELARQTGLSMPTIMKITDGFIRNGLVDAVGKGPSNGGKPPEMLELIPDARLFLGLDASGHTYRMIIMNLCGDIVYRRDIRKNMGGCTLSGADLFIKLIEDCLAQSHIDREKLAGIGIGMPTPVDAHSGVVLKSDEMQEQNYDVTTPVSRCFGIPVLLENTAKVMAMGEKWFGKGSDIQDFVMITIGRGIGAAIIINGEIYRGANNMSGEVGHMVIDPNGPLCKCGARGCLETLASGEAIGNQAKALLRSGAESKMIGMGNGNIGEIGYEIVFQAASEGDPAALGIINKAVEYLAIGICNVVNIFDVDLVVLTGNVVRCNHFMVSMVNKAVNKRRHMYFGDHSVKVILSKLGEDAPAIGAATLPLKEMLAGMGI